MFSSGEDCCGPEICSFVAKKDATTNTGNNKPAFSRDASRWTPGRKPAKRCDDQQSLF
jgi:hypothetical protein